MAVKMMTHAERCREESTKDVVFLLRWRTKRSRHWEVDSVWRDREEAEAYGRQHEHRWGRSLWSVYGIPSKGDLAEILQADPLTRREKKAAGA